MGDAKSHLENARTSIQDHIGPIIQYSSIYSTKAWGKTDQPDFLNQVIEISEPYAPAQLLNLVLNTETQLGRVRKEKWGERIIDIDILFFNQEIINEKNLIIPHPEIANRKFTLIPLAEVAADLIHPVLKKTITQLLSDCKDKLEVKKL